MQILSIDGEGQTPQRHPARRGRGGSVTGHGLQPRITCGIATRGMQRGGKAKRRIRTHLGAQQIGTRVGWLGRLRVGIDQTRKKHDGALEFNLRRRGIARPTSTVQRHPRLQRASPCIKQVGALVHAGKRILPVHP